MDWNHVAFTVESSLPGLVVVAAVSALCAWLARPDRRWLAASPGLAAVPLVAACSLLAGVPDIQHARWAVIAPQFGFLAVALLTVPSALALRRRWLGVVHVATLAATALLWFVCIVSIAHDGP